MDIKMRSMTMNKHKSSTVFQTLLLTTEKSPVYIQKSRQSKTFYDSLQDTYKNIRYFYLEKGICTNDTKSYVHKYTITLHRNGV